MTTKARVVLQDARQAIFNHSDRLQSEDFRVSWFSIVAMLRAVGHVLDKVDGESTPHVRRAVDEKWRELTRTKPEPRIFWSFIEHERNRFLKNYEHGIVRTFTYIGPDHDGQTTVLVEDLSNARGGSSFSEEALFETRISDGPYAGQHERDVALEAHDWWKSYLDAVDSLARAYEAV